MYKPSRQNWIMFEKLKEMRIWDEGEKLLKKYQKKWNGPDIDIYIFPIQGISGFHKEESSHKSGVSFKDRMFLFVSPFEDIKELEALFVHEYHHVCRINKQKKALKDYRLLDSMILEGLAEYAVKENCGESYLAKWCNYYTEKEIESFWNKFIKFEINVNKRNDLHDQILYGVDGYPKLVGYATGFYLVNEFMKTKNFSTKTSFLWSPETFVNKNFKN